MGFGTCRAIVFWSTRKGAFRLAPRAGRINILCMKTVKLAFISAGLFAFADQVLACPGCKDALAGANSVANPWGTAYNASIMFMLGTVLVIVGSAAYGIFRIARAEERRTLAGVGGVAVPVAAPTKKTSLLKFVLPAVGVLYAAFIAAAMSRATPTQAAEQTVIDIPSLNDGTFRSAQMVNAAMVVDFGAAWCPNCKKSAPEFVRVAKARQPQTKFFQVDVDLSPVTAKALKIDELPCFVLFINNEEVARRTGFASEAELSEWLDKNTPKADVPGASTAK